MSIPKPTAVELKQWEETLQQEDLSMRRGANESRVVYGYEDRGLTISTWEDAKNHTKAQLSRLCIVCASKFLGRSDAKFCSNRCKKEANSAHQKAKGLVWLNKSTL